MGASTMLDMIGSFVVGGMLFLMALRLNASAVEESSVYNGNLILQQNMTTTVNLIETDFRKIGYCRNWRMIPDPSQSIRIADSNRLRFWTDLGNDGTLDSLTYYLGPASELNDTPNPRDRFLYRQEDANPPERMNLGITQFQLRYRDAEDSIIAFPVTDPREVNSLELSIAIESAAPMTQQYMNDTSQYQVFWRQIRLVTKNLRNR